MDEAEIRDLVGQLLRDGKSLNEILNYLKEEKGVSMTYLDLRLIAAEFEEATPEEPAEGKPQDEEEGPEDKQTAAGATIEFDTVVQSDAQVSGRATLASGAKLQWLLDAFGRLQIGLESGSPQPSEAELLEFQQSLIDALRQRYGQL